MKLSIVASLYQSEAHINEFYTRSTTAARQLSLDDYEIILVNDGSPDNSLNLAVALAKEDSHVVVVDLSRNFGHHKAMMTGLARSKGKLVFLIDSDLEEKPEWLLNFDSQMKREHCDVVFGIQERRKGNWFERWSGQWFYRFFRALTRLALPENATTSRLMTRRYVDALLSHQEREVFIAGLWHITGFDQRPQVVNKKNGSVSTYTVRKKVSLLVKSITSFSNAPLIGIFYVGISISLLTLTYITYLTLHWYLLEKPLTGWTTIIASIWLLGGMMISFIGIVGIYISKIFLETKQRPYTIVRQVYAQKKDEGS